ncbi:MAG: hypothetical protein WCT49_03000 [Candidatus Paceibacterota bacterium]|jgi:hypothetical protein|nr:hypothetical protein [Candidatus Paceibacterota bacterium]
MTDVGERSAHAFHEAGHAVVAIAMNKIKVLDILLDGTGGTTNVKWSEGMNFEKLCFYIAGEMTECLYSEKYYSEQHCWSDRVYTQTVLFLISHDRNEQYKFWILAIKKVREIFEDPKNVILLNKIAAVLMVKDVLTEDEINAMVNDGEVEV